MNDDQLEPIQPADETATPVIGDDVVPMEEAAPAPGPEEIADNDSPTNGGDTLEKDDGELGATINKLLFIFLRGGSRKAFAPRKGEEDGERSEVHRS
ncbi:TPA: hypothetical protein DHW58_01240 [Patescibacteria group bacterium]|nr:hypothetical protein [Patescibacteria group bacterium]